MSLSQIANYIADSVENRSRKGMNFGVVIIPEGVVEFVPEFKKLISEINELLAGENANEFNNLPTWKEKYGLVVTDVAMGDINITEASLARINKIDDATIFSDAKLQSGLMATASAEALTTAAGNANGAMMGFAGMNLATNAGAGLMGAVNQNVQAAPAPQAAAGVVATGGAVPNFCPNCGTATNGANFCGNCGTKLN
jgi:membrane protease subunit (stomatin/prohibitin family)